MKIEVILSCGVVNLCIFSESKNTQSEAHWSPFFYCFAWTYHFPKFVTVPWDLWKSVNIEFNYEQNMFPASRPTRVILKNEWGFADTYLCRYSKYWRCISQNMPAFTASFLSIKKGFPNYFFSSFLLQSHNLCKTKRSMGYKLNFHHKIFGAYIQINLGHNSLNKSNCFIFCSNKEIITTRSGVISHLPKT